MADAGTPLIAPGQRLSEAQRDPSPLSVGEAERPIAARDRASDDAEAIAFYQSGDSFGASGASARPARHASLSRLALPRLSAALDNDSSIARAHQPLLSPGSGRPMHPLLSPFGGDEVRFDVPMSAEDHAAYLLQRWTNAQPEDVFVHAFSFLTPKELAAVGGVNRGWRHAASEPSLWTHIDLSPLYTRVDDAFVTHLLGSERFVQLRTLVLEGCSAITHKSIKSILYFCPNLRELRLTHCNHIANPWVLVELVKALPYLRKLELFGVTKEFAIVPPILAARPNIELGLFWLEYCAENGMRLSGRGLANCRYDEAHDNAVHLPVGAAMQRGCWGRIKGRIVYDNTFYHRGGNFPHEVLYSCANHTEADFLDETYARCHVCENLFRREGGSMWTPLICRVCFDEENLRQKATWVSLDERGVREFGLGHVVSKTIHVASRKNLPVSLRSFGSVPARLDYTLPEPEAEDGADRNEQAPMLRQRIDPTDVPLSAFLAVNGWRLDESVHQLRGKLQDAADGLNTRALLVYDSDDRIEVLADKRVILEGREGEEHLQLIVSAWHQALEILYPIVIVMILALHFSVMFVKQTQSHYDGTTNYDAYIRAPSDDGMSPLLVLAIAAIGLVLLIVCIFLIYRYREACERCFKRFLVADILLIFMFGVATMLWLLIAQWNAYLDTLTFVGVIWNLSIIGLLSLYYPMPERLHHFFLLLLNAIMAIMMYAALGRWLVLTFLLIFAVGDVVSELRPHMRWLSPFLIPANVELIYNTPKILYTVGGLRLRAADLFCYGMLMGLAVASGSDNADYPSVLLGASFVFVCVMASLALMLFVAPFLGCRFRPLPLAVISAFIATMIEDDIFVPYLAAQNMLTRPVIKFH